MTEAGPRHRVLLTGFEPFAGAAINPSWDAVARVAERGLDDVELAVERLPVVFTAARAALAEAVRRHDPQLVIAVGLAEGRDAVTPERIGINLDDARIPDNSGAQPIDAPIEADGPAARFSTLPVKAVVAALQEAGIPAAVSHTAGTFVCNSVLYSLLGATEQRPGTRAGFIHVPATPELGAPGAPTLDTDTLADALVIAVRVSLTANADIAAVGGALH